MTITKVYKYQTKDGKLHDTLDKAKDHVCERICEVFDKIIKPNLGKNGIHTANDSFKFITTLSGDYEKAKKLIKDLNTVFDDIDTDLQDEI